jgi:hypothetical protein
MTRQTRPDSQQLNLGLCTDMPLNLPQQRRTELAAALADMLLQAITAPETKATPTEGGDKSETHG